MTEMMETSSAGARGWARGWGLLALLVSVPIPTVGTYLAMVAFPDAAWAKVLFFVAKLWMLAVPVLWVWWVARGRIVFPRWSSRGMWAAHGTGLVTFGVIVGAYVGFAHRWIEFGPMREKIAVMGLDRRWVYLLGAVYWCTVNSLLEEYFWRWFVFGRLRDGLSRFSKASGFWAVLLPGVAVVVSGLLFTVHHVIALDVYFDWRVTVLGSLGVLIGGVTWSGLYARYGNIYAGYVSHVYADVAIFGIGWWLIFGG